MTDENKQGDGTVVVYSTLGSRLRIAEHKLDKFLAAGFKKTKPRNSTKAASAADGSEGAGGEQPPAE